MSNHVFYLIHYQAHPYTTCRLMRACEFFTRREIDRGVQRVSGYVSLSKSGNSFDKKFKPGSSHGGDLCP